MTAPAVSTAHVQTAANLTAAVGVPATASTAISPAGIISFIEAVSPEALALLEAALAQFGFGAPKPTK